MNNQVHLNILFDFICPWCWIAKRQLTLAMQQLQQSHPKLQLHIQWQGIQLLADLPREGVDFQAFYLNRFNNLTALKRRQEQVCQIAESVQIKLNYQYISRMPNTAVVHQFFNDYAERGDVQQHQQLLEGIFSAYFQSGEDIGDVMVLQKIALDCGYQERAVLPQYSHNYHMTARAKSVPYFSFNDDVVVLSGAQPAEMIYQAIVKAFMVSTKESGHD